MKSLALYLIASAAIHAELIRPGESQLLAAQDPIGSIAYSQSLTLGSSEFRYENWRMDQSTVWYFQIDNDLQNSDAGWDSIAINEAWRGKPLDVFRVDSAFGGFLDPTIDPQAGGTPVDITVSYAPDGQMLIFSFTGPLEPPSISPVFAARQWDGDVPEPSYAMLAGIGALILIAMAKRRRRL